MNFADYKALDEVNWSTLKEMRQSPLHYRYRVEHPREDSTRLALGRAAHTAVFEPDRFLVEYACYKGAIRRGKKWDAFKEQHAGETILKLDEYQLCLAIRDAVRSNADAMKYLAAGIGEQTIRWKHAGTGIACKGRVDWVSKSSPAVVDFKTTSTIETAKFGAQVARMGYHAQLAWYRDGIAYSGGEILPAVIIAAEVNPPHDVGVFVLDEDALYAGAEEYGELLHLLADCRKANRWPGRFSEAQSLRLPTWAWNDEDDGDATGLDLVINGHSTGG